MEEGAGEKKARPKNFVPLPPSSKVESFTREIQPLGEKTKKREPSARRCCEGGGGGDGEERKGEGRRVGVEESATFTVK